MKEVQKNEGSQDLNYISLSPLFIHFDKLRVTVVGISHHFQEYFSYLTAVSCIARKQNTRRKLTTILMMSNGPPIQDQ